MNDKIKTDFKFGYGRRLLGIIIHRLKSNNQKEQKCVCGKLSIADPT
jgi:hypothetical protein